MSGRRWWLALGGAVLLSCAIAAGGGYWLRSMLPPPATAAELDPERARLATRFLDLLDAGEVEAALAMTTPKMQEGLGNGRMEAIWRDLPAKLGPRRQRHAPRGEAIDGRPIVTVALEFAPATLDARVVFDDEQRIAGFWLVPNRKPAAPAPVATDRFAEHEAAVAGLPATLTLPRGEGPFPALVFVHGSGPNDRDETVGPNRPFRDLAHGLAERGIASLRYDKRTLIAPQSFADGDFDIDEETTDDAVAAVHALRADARIDGRRVFVLGHSQGAMMAPRIAQRVDVAGLVLLAAPARPLQDVYIAQLRYLGAPQAEAEAEKARDPARNALMGLPARYWDDLMRYDAVRTAQALGIPLLLLQGGRDYQVTPSDDLSRWRAAFASDPCATLREYPMANHLFIAGEGAPSPADYERAGTVLPGVVSDIADWVDAR